MEWFYTLLTTAGVDALAASWATAAVAVIILFYVVRTFVSIFSR